MILDFLILIKNNITILYTGDHDVGPTIIGPTGHWADRRCGQQDMGPTDSGPNSISTDRLHGQQPMVKKKKN